jgi:hypothetical protein
MSEITPDPVIGKLAKFTPDGSALDPAELLFAAGRASARTHWFWKVAVGGLLVANFVCVGFLVLRSQEAMPEAHIIPVAVPVVLQQQEVPAAPPVPSTDDPWSYRSLLSAGDPERFPKPEPMTEPVPAVHPLTPLSARRGEID